MNFELPLQLKPTCMCLRHKMMYCDQRQDRPGLVDSTSDTRIYFCTQSQDSIGLDNEPVHPDQCKQGRACYCSEESL